MACPIRSAVFDPAAEAGAALGGAAGERARGRAKSEEREQLVLKKADNHWTEIKSGKVTYRIVGMPDRDFPKACRRRRGPGRGTSPVAQDVGERRDHRARDRIKGVPHGPVDALVPE